MKTYDEIKQHFNNLNNDISHFVNSNDICTPMECVKEMVDSVPTNFWNNDKKILDCCCGNGNFHGYIQTKTNIDNLYFNEINEERIKNLKNYFGDNINLTTNDFLEYDETIKYDMIVANPPYAKFTDGKRASKNHNMSRAFIEKALNVVKDDGYLLFIVPNNWMSYSDRNVLPKILSQYQFIHLDIHGAKKYFPKVGSSFTWFLLQKKPNTESFNVYNNYYMKDVQYTSIDSNTNFLPLYMSDLTKSIIKKTTTYQEKYNIQTSSDLHKYTKRDLISIECDETHKYKLIHTPTQTVWSRRPHKFQDGYKIFLSLTDQYETFIDSCGMTQSVAFIRCESTEEAERIQQELNNPVYKFVNNITRYGNFNNVRVLQSFTTIDNILLTEKEDKLIEAFNNIYYKTKKK